MQPPAPPPDRPALPRTLDELPPLRRETFEARLDRWLPDLEAALRPAVRRPGPVARRLVELAARAFAARADDLHRLDLKRSLEPDWFQRPEMLGYAAYADRFAGTLAGVAERTPYLADLGVTLPAPDAAADTAPGAERRRLRGRRLPQRAPRPRHHGRPAGADRAAARRRDQPVPRPGAQPRRARARRGPRRRGRATRATATTSYVYPDRDDAGRVRAHPAGGVPRLRARQLHLGRRAGRLGLDDVQRLPVGRQLVEPRRALRVRRHHPVPGQPRRRGAPARRDRVHLEADGHQLPEPARGARDHPGAAHGRPDRLPGGGVQGRGDRRPAGPGRPTSGRARTTARSATSPTTTA